MQLAKIIYGTLTDKAEKNCSLCKWFSPAIYHDDDYGGCHFPENLLPDSYRYDRTSSIAQSERSVVTVENGKECVFFNRKSTV